MKSLLLVITLVFLLFVPTHLQAQKPAADDSPREANPRHRHGQGHDANAHMNRHAFDDLVKAFEDEDRAAWQKPAEVLELLGDLDGKTVMDIGSGTGYFSFRLAEAGAKVICADVDQRFLDFIAERMEQEGVSPDRMELRKVPYDSSRLRPDEADFVLIVNTYHHIQDREAYFAEVREGLKPDGKLVVIDFFKRETPHGPPVAMKLAEDQVVAELVRAGFSGFRINRELLPYQYIIEAY